MSTFNGFIEEIDCISVDRFTANNFRSNVFFLSHCHSDHMIGLSEINREHQLPGPLYLSEISLVILKRMYPTIDNLIALKIGETIPISVPGKPVTFTVTAIPAGHCPGSIMLLFEQNSEKVLYTGDFRLYRQNIETINALKRFHNTEISLNSLYLDSTFLSMDYQHFPTQRESIETIIKLTEDWLQQNDKNIIILRPPANYGYEYLFIELSKHFRQKIHITGSVFNDYRYIPDFDQHIDNLKRLSGRIHLCSSNDSAAKWHTKNCACLPSLSEDHIRVIRPTAMKWKNLTETARFHMAHDSIENVFFVCYSNHASYEEIEHLIQYLRPQKVHLNVLPDDGRQRRNMESALRAITKDDDEKNFATELESKSLGYTFNNIRSTQVISSVLSLNDEVSRIRTKKRRKQ